MMLTARWWISVLIFSIPKGADQHAACRAPVLSRTRRGDDDHGAGRSGVTAA